MRPVVVVGIGELGSVFARGLLKTGHPVFPVTRGVSANDVARVVPEPELALVAVGEDDLAPALAALPRSWRDRVGLLQNELLPPSWAAHGIEQPTVAVVWFEKKPTMLARQLLPTPVFGPHAALLEAALAAVGIETRRLPSEEELFFELALKNLYILTTNLAGLDAPGTVSELCERHGPLVERVSKDVLTLTRALTSRELDEPRLMSGLFRAVAADPAHAATGRSAPARLARALSRARSLGVAVPELERLSEKTR